MIKSDDEQQSENLFKLLDILNIGLVKAANLKLALLAINNIFL